MADDESSRSKLFRVGKTAFRKLGYHCDNPVVVIESDDWGAVRIPSIQALKEFEHKYPERELDHYQSYDTLDTVEDIEMLSDVLERHNQQTSSPVFTMNFAMANPVFQTGNDRIGTPFLWEPISNTYQKYYGRDTNPIDTIVSLSSRGIIHPQLHGREHLNVTSWRYGILNDKKLKYAYELHMVGLNDGKYCGLDALNRANTEISHYEYIEDSIMLFEVSFGFVPMSFIAPCYVIGADEERELASHGVRILQGGWLTNRTNSKGKLLRLPTVLGSKGHSGLIKLVRNCQLEPAWFYRRGKSSEECVTKALKYVKEAFQAKQPAIVCSHRVNYVGGIDRSNREFGLKCLDSFLSEVMRRWPMVRFMSSDELGEQVRRISCKGDDK